MMLNCYSIYDRKSLVYHSPFFSVADGAAVRSFSDLANDPQTNIGRHPADYVLYKVGMWDDQKGALLPEVPMHLTDALPLVKAPEPRLFGSELQDHLRHLQPKQEAK